MKLGARWCMALFLVAAAVFANAPSLRADSCTFHIEYAPNGDIIVVEECDYPLISCDYCFYAYENCRDECAALFNDGLIDSSGLMSCNTACTRARGNCYRNCQY